MIIIVKILIPFILFSLCFPQDDNATWEIGKRTKLDYDLITNISEELSNTNKDFRPVFDGSYDSNERTAINFLTDAILDAQDQLAWASFNILLFNHTSDVARPYLVEQNEYLLKRIEGTREQLNSEVALVKNNQGVYLGNQAIKSIRSAQKVIKNSNAYFNGIVTGSRN